MDVQHTIGFVIWPKLPVEIEHRNRCCSDAQLGEYLAGTQQSDDPEYAQEIMRMRNSILDTIKRLRERRIRLVRIGVSWAEADSIGGRQWIEWYLQRFAEAGFDLLPCINYTPNRFAKAQLEKLRLVAGDNTEYNYLLTAISKTGMTNIPPEPLEAFGMFITEFLGNAKALGLQFSWIELWNEPNIDTDWHPDPRIATIALFVEMIAPAAAAVRAQGMQVLLGGLSGVKLEWLEKACAAGLLKHVDAIGLHGLRGTWSDLRVRPSWDERIASLQEVMRRYGSPVPVWITEVGFATIDFRETEDRLDDQTLEAIQAAIFAEAVFAVQQGATPRAYWYAESDWIGQSTRHSTTGWEDVIQFFFGDRTIGGRKKLLYQLLEKGGPAYVLTYVSMHHLEGLAATIIDRGDPKTWEEKTAEIIEVYRKKEQNEIAV